MKTNLLKRIFAGFTAAALITACAACGNGNTAQTTTSGTTEAPAATDDSLRKILDAKKLVLGLDASFPPMGFTDENNEIVGFDIDVAQEVCDRMGIELVKQPINWDTKEEDLNLGKIDCIWNGMSINAARAEAMNLSEPYMKNEMIFVVPGSSEVKSMSDLKGRTVGVQTGSTAQEILEASDLYADITVTPLEDNVTLLNQMELGFSDAVFLDSVVAYYFIASNNKDYFVLPGNLEAEEYAIGFRKADQALRDKVQAVLSEMKADGKLAEISNKWFGSDVTTVK
ncbi:MAG: amino acid ABC transporter substrate-binding protein [Ruminiclostridium sp.]|nr:amino acid ABC transporter substrate-binding protein [Ruminiclostridium sp.]